MTRAREHDGKPAFPNRKAAETYRVQKLIQTGAASNNLRSYRCRFCRAWHVGHPRWRRWQR